MRNDQDVAGQTQIIWRDPKKQGWKPKTSYRVYIQHQPKTGIIRLKIYEGSVKIIDSGHVIDTGWSYHLLSTKLHLVGHEVHLPRRLKYFLNNHVFQKYLFLFCPFKYENTALKRRMLY